MTAAEHLALRFMLRNQTAFAEGFESLRVQIYKARLNKVFELNNQSDLMLKLVHAEVSTC